MHVNSSYLLLLLSSLLCCISLISVGTQLTNKWSLSEERRLKTSITQSQSQNVFVCVSVKLPVYSRCMLEILKGNQPEASNAEQLSVSWVTQAYSAGNHKVYSWTYNGKYHIHAHKDTHTQSCPSRLYPIRPRLSICPNASKIIQNIITDFHL